MASTRNTKAEPPAATFPLFYRQPQALAAAVHGDLRLKGEADFRFAARTNAAPIMTAEFVEAQHAYPIVFVGEPLHPAVVLGLEQDNLFVASDGAWAPDRYIPAYVRRYPFVFIETAERARYALGIDVASERLVSAPEGGEGTQPLFADGQPTPLTQEALHFSSALQQSQLVSRAFCNALLEQDLLVDQQAQGVFPDGRPFNLQGFRIVDAGRFQAAPDSVVVEWHRNGWLALVHQHLASLARWRDLLARKNAAPGSAAVAELVEA